MLKVGFVGWREILECSECNGGGMLADSLLPLGAYGSSQGPERGRAQPFLLASEERVPAKPNAGPGR